MKWKSYADLLRDTEALARKLPRDTYAVIGVARSGFLPASLLAQHLQCLLGEAQAVAETGEMFAAGPRLESKLHASRSESLASVSESAIFCNDAAETCKSAMGAPPLV